MNLFVRDDELVIVGLSINLSARPTSPTQRPMGGSDCQNGSVAGQLEINFRVFDSVSSSTTHNPLKPTRPVRSLKIRQKTQPVRSFHFSDFYTLSPSVSYFHALSFSNLSLKSLSLTLLTAAAMVKFSYYRHCRRQAAQTLLEASSNFLEISFDLVHLMVG